MTILDQVHTLPAIKKSFEAITQKVATFSAQYPNEVFFAPFGEKWSMAENLEHLILSNNAIAKTLSYPKDKLAERFGTAQRPSLEGNTIIDLYLAALQKNPIKSPVGYTPENTAEKPKSDLMTMWENSSSQFQNFLKNWTEEDLDTYQVPHPLLGNMHVREMVLFAIYHTEHHLKAMERIAQATT